MYSCREVARLRYPELPQLFVNFHCLGESVGFPSCLKGDFSFYRKQNFRQDDEVPEPSYRVVEGFRVEFCTSSLLKSFQLVRLGAQVSNNEFLCRRKLSRTMKKIAVLPDPLRPAYNFDLAPFRSEVFRGFYEVIL